MAHLHENQVAARALLVLHVSFIDCMIAQIEVSRKSLGGKIEVQQYLHSNMYVSGPIFVKLANEFYVNIYHLAAYLRL